jgi:S1-C subfamily serine protease
MSNVLIGVSNDLAEIVGTTGLAVIRVDARRRLPASGVLWSSEGLIVTAHHVVHTDENISVGLPDGQTTAAKLVGRDPTTDLAVLRVPISGLTPPTWAGADRLQVGHLVLALGRPTDTIQATLGIISALGGGWRTRGGGQVDHYLQTDVVMYPGFSGGPLVNAAGHVIGISTSALRRGTSLAVPTATVRRVVEDLVAHGQVRRAYLGVGIQPARLPAMLAEQLEQETGLLLVSVEPDSPAARAGLFMGDTLVTFDDQPVRHHDDLLSLLTGDRVGATVVVRFVRGGQLQDLTVVIGEQS